MKILTFFVTSTKLGTDSSDQRHPSLRAGYPRPRSDWLIPTGPRKLESSSAYALRTKDRVFESLCPDH